MNDKYKENKMVSFQQEVISDPKLRSNLQLFAASGLILVVSRILRMDNPLFFDSLYMGDMALYASSLASMAEEKYQDYPVPKVKRKIKK